MLRVLAIITIIMWLATTVAIDVAFTDVAPAAPTLQTLSDAFV
jgi:hypothetical protein